MRRSKYLLPFIILLLFLQGNSSCREVDQVKRPILNEGYSSTEYIPGELIVKFKSEAFDEKGKLVSEPIKALNAKYGLISIEPLFKRRRSGPLAYIYKLKFSKELDVPKLVQEYTNDHLVIYAEPNYTVRTLEGVTDAD